MHPFRILFFLAITGITLFSCQDLRQIDFLQLTISSVDSLSINTVAVQTEIQDHLYEVIDDHGLVWTQGDSLPSLTQNEGQRTKGPLNVGDSPSFSDTLTLEPDAEYTLRAYAVIGERVFYSPEINSLTGTAQVSTIEYTYTSGNSIELTGSLHDIKIGIKAIQHGFCWSSIHSDPDLTDDFINLGVKQSDGSFSGTISGLLNDTAYYFRAYALLSIDQKFDTLYGQTITFDGNLKDVWMKKAPFPGGPRAYSISFVIDDVPYMGGGLSADGYQSDFWKYDSWSDTWTSIADFPDTTSILSSGFSINGTGYAGEPQKLFSYSPSSDTWNLVVDPGIPTGGCPAEYWALGGGPTVANVVIGNTAYFFHSGTLLPHSPTMVFTFTPEEADTLSCFCMDLEFFDPSPDRLGFSLNSKYYYGLFNQFEEFDPAATDPCATPSLPNVPGQGGVRHGSIGFSIGNKGYSGLGLNNNQINKNDLWEYDLLLNQWTRRTDFPDVPLRYSTVFTSRGRAYVGTGFQGLLSTNDELTAEFYEYDPE